MVENCPCGTGYSYIIVQSRTAHVGKGRAAQVLKVRTAQAGKSRAEHVTRKTFRNVGAIALLTFDYCFISIAHETKIVWERLNTITCSRQNTIFASRHFQKTNT